MTELISESSLERPTIKSVTFLTSDDLYKGNSDHVQLTYNEKGDLIALKWPFLGYDDKLLQKARRSDSYWDRDYGWTFVDPRKANRLLDAVVSAHPRWKIIGDPKKPHHISRIVLNNGYEACLMPVPLLYCSYGADMPVSISIAVEGKGRGVGMVLGLTAEIELLIEAMTSRGCVCGDKLASKWRFASGNDSLRIEVSRSVVRMICNIKDPMHYLLATKRARKHLQQPMGYERFTGIEWDGVINTTRTGWEFWQGCMSDLGIRWAGDDPNELPLSVAVASGDFSVSGWSRPAPNGFLLHEYQKEGALFCISRGMRALIGDEMGVGKTVQAISAAGAVDASKILVVCPASARFVWDREIKGWGGRGTIQHILSQLDTVDQTARWYIVTYDLLSKRTATWRLNDRQEKQAFSDAFPHMKHSIEETQGRSNHWKVSIDKFMDGTPAFTDQKRVTQWQRMMQRLRGDIIKNLKFDDQILVILDEAHRVKNKDAKRTQSVQQLVAGVQQLILMTGTPLRNNEHEAAVLLGLLDADAAAVLEPKLGYTVEDIKDFLSYFMIRRTKQEVLPELPEKTRQRIDISDFEKESLSDYYSAINSGRMHYLEALGRGGSEKEARESTRGDVAKARVALAMAKIGNGQVAELIADVVLSKQSCVVFCAHHNVSDKLKRQLEKQDLRVAVVDGRMHPRERNEVVDAFQDGSIDVFIGGINSTGEAITLTRADTVIFIELDWVPAAMLQAEDRIHRVGQKNNCHIIQLVAKLPLEDNLDEMMVELLNYKSDRINFILDEEYKELIAGKSQSELLGRLFGYGSYLKSYKGVDGFIDV